MFRSDGRQTRSDMSSFRLARDSPRTSISQISPTGHDATRPENRQVLLTTSALYAVAIIANLLPIFRSVNALIGVAGDMALSVTRKRHTSAITLNEERSLRAEALSRCG